jgi:asparagine synthase (glutamine-hydrolysing)
MCGIFASLSKIPTPKTQHQLQNLRERFQKIAYRGPDKSYEFFSNSIFLGFHRLAIMGLSEKEDCILNSNGIYLLCNGEIYNHRYYAEKYDLKLETSSDCEVILKVYEKSPDINYLTETFQSLDGDFAFVIWDSVKEILVACRDRIGVRPLFIKNGDKLEFASEEKSLIDSFDLENSMITQVEPGCLIYHQNNHLQTIKWWDSYSIQVSHIDYNMAQTFIRELLINSVKKRLVADRPVGFLLSGGLDSSLVAAIASKIIPITTFSIGYENSSDLIAAKKVAEYIGSTHHEIILKDEYIINYLHDLIYTLGCYDITTIRASMPMYIISKYISENTDIKVLFSGEGSDELFSGYLYLHKAPNNYELQKELESLVHNLYLFDVRRADRTTARWGLELRVPFLDADVVSLAMSLHPSIKMGKTRIEKAVVRDAFSSLEILPHDILYRRKEAFSDGVGSRSIELLKQLGVAYMSNRDLDSKLLNFAIPYTDESKMYYDIFRGFYKDFNDTYKYWLPKWDKCTDPSATLLSHY